MINTKKEQFILRGLNCSSCAGKIEKEVANLVNVSSSNINFATGVLTVIYKEKASNIVQEIKKIVRKHESHVKVEEKEKAAHQGQDSAFNKLELIRLSIGAIMFAVAVIFKLNTFFELFFFVSSYILIGGEVVLKAFRNIAKVSFFDENFLMTIATLGAFAIREFPEAVAVMLFYQIGETFQRIAVNKSRKSIKSLLDIRPDYANLKIENGTKKVDPQDVSIGDIIIIKPGEKVPLDGIVIKGESMVDTSALTGESLHRSINNGDDILSGFVNKNGLLEIEVTKTFEQSTVSKILDLVENAGSKKADIESFITKFARYYTPLVVFSALLIAVIPPIVLQGASFSDWVYRALVFLVVSCPCALVISIPLGFFGGIGGASRAGILVKGGNYLDALNDVDTVVFDKTGTLTKGTFTVTGIESYGNYDKNDILRLAAISELHSSHPIGKSIVEMFKGEVNENIIEDYQDISGQGIVAKIEGKTVLTGNVKLLKNFDIDNIKINNDNTNENTSVYVAIDGKLEGRILISDEVKRDSKSAIQKLRTLGVKKILMLTGDNRHIGNKIGRNLELDEVYSELLPDEKVHKLEKIEKDTRGKLVFVGDGINDAPVLARADIGVSMGSLGSDAAIEASDIVLMTDEPSKLPQAIKIARRTKIIVIQNIVFALGTKGVVLLLGAFGIASMWEAVFADVGVALLAVLNSMRAMKVDEIKA